MLLDRESPNLKALSDGEVAGLSAKIPSSASSKQKFEALRWLRAAHEGRFAPSRGALAKVEVLGPVHLEVIDRLRAQYESSSAERATKGADVELEELEGLAGVSFETVVMNLLRAAGAEQVRGTPVTGDQGADVLFEFGGRRVVVQAKRYASNVGNKAVHEVHAAKGFYGCDDAWVVTNADFTASAKQLAGQLGVFLLGGPELQRFEEVFSSRFNAR